MSDIHNQREIENLQAEIDRLRQILENIQQARVSQGKAIIDANNEIERLRADNQKVALEYLGQIGQLSDENTRLRAALEVTSSDCKEAFAENERLRAALEVAANDLEDWGAYTKAKNARAALEGE